MVPIVEYNKVGEKQREWRNMTDISAHYGCSYQWVQKVVRQGREFQGMYFRPKGHGEFRSKVMLYDNVDANTGGRCLARDVFIYDLY